MILLIGMESSITSMGIVNPNKTQTHTLLRLVNEDR